MENTTGKEKETLRLKIGFEGDYLLEEESRTLKPIGIFYAPAGGNVHKIAWMLKHKLAEYDPELFCISEIRARKMLDYSNLVFVCSSLGRNTWEMEQRDRWAAFLPEMREIDLHSRNVAIVALGDHVTYPDNFVDVLGFLAATVEEVHGHLIGRTPTVDYIFNDSRGIRDGEFMGLPIDEDYEPEKTGRRMDSWLTGILRQLA